MRPARATPRGQRRRRGTVPGPGMGRGRGGSGSRRAGGEYKPRGGASQSPRRTASGRCRKPAEQRPPRRAESNHSLGLLESVRQAAPLHRDRKTRRVTRSFSRGRLRECWWVFSRQDSEVLRECWWVSSRYEVSRETAAPCSGPLGQPRQSPPANASESP